MNALVVFHGHGAGLLARLFGRPGFRHCFVAVQDARGYWLSLDGRADRPRLELVAGPGEDMVEFYRKAGLTVTPVRISDAAGGRGSYTRWLPPLMLGTCVGAVKKIIGIGNPFILTPRQLYLHLQKGDPDGLVILISQAAAASAAPADAGGPGDQEAPGTT